MTDLSKLSPRVRRAVECLETLTCSLYEEGAVQIVVAELTRLSAVEAELAVAPTVAITECNQIPGASDFDMGDMTAAVQRFKPGQRVRLLLDPATPEAASE